MTEILSKEKNEIKLLKDNIVKKIFSGEDDSSKMLIASIIEEATIDIIKSMLDNDVDYNFISKVTGKTIEEIKEIEKNK